MIDNENEDKDTASKSESSQPIPAPPEPQSLASEPDAPRARRVPVADISEDDDETWTNQPAGQAPVEPDESLDDIDDDDDEEESAPVTRKVIQTGRDVVTDELPARAQRARDRMRPHLTGLLVIELSNSGEKFFFDWRGEDAKVTPVTGEVTVASAENTSPSAVDCIISVTEQNLMAIRSGDLNPQVAMLADKIRVRGKMSPAVYLFNLVAPRLRPQ